MCTKIGMTDRERKSVNYFYTFPGPTDLGSTYVFENVARIVRNVRISLGMV